MGIDRFGNWTEVGHINMASQYFDVRLQDVIFVQWQQTNTAFV
jgi:hypothetical protein